MKDLIKLMKDNPVARAFVATALVKFADAILADEDKVRKDMERSIIHPEAWIQIAKEVKELSDI